MPRSSLPLVVHNLDTATFECTFGRGCDGICCKNGRPSVDQEERARIAAVLPRVLPLLRPEARTLVEAAGFLSRRRKLGEPMVRVTDGWCVFFNKGCVLHTIGAEDGDPLQYKPTQCALFPIEPGDHGDWFIRQWGYHREEWDLFCLNPANSRVPAAESLAGELALAAALERDREELVPARSAPGPATPRQTVG
jgi:hypothetical protein